VQSSQQRAMRTSLDFDTNSWLGIHVTLAEGLLSSSTHHVW
jgi:hypothetical protein